MFLLLRLTKTPLNAAFHWNKFLRKDASSKSSYNGKIYSFVYQLLKILLIQVLSYTSKYFFWQACSPLKNKLKNQTKTFLTIGQN